MTRIRLIACLIAAVALASAAAAISSTAPAAKPAAATKTAAKPGAAKPDAAAKAKEIERGRYLTTVSGCQDCHTPGTMFGAPDFARQLSGSELGWQGPWGPGAPRTRGTSPPISRPASATTRKTRS